jgi:hypothetical protein
MLGGNGNPQAEFLRVYGAWRLTSGAIVVVNGASNELRVFDSHGAPLSTFGRKGQGPGEFESISWTGHAGDTAFVFDGSNKRITTVVLSATPRLISTLTVTATGGRAQFGVTGRLSDERWVVTTHIMPNFDGPVGVHRLQTSTGLIPASGAGTVEWIEAQPSAAIFVNNPTGDMKQALVGIAAFSPFFTSVGSATSVWYGESGADSIMKFDAPGARRRVALPFAPTAPTPAMAAAARRAEEERDGAIAQSERSRSFSDVKYGKYLPKFLPVFGGILPVSDGGVWVSSYPATRADQTRYIVISARGAPTAMLTVPAGFRVTDVGPDFVVGIHQDDDGVESVRVYRLRRG